MLKDRDQYKVCSTLPVDNLTLLQVVNAFTEAGRVGGVSDPLRGYPDAL